MMKTCDLHTHSVFSDGTYTPSEIIDGAILLGLSTVALTDHNTVDGLSEFVEYAKDKDIEAIAGAEFSVDYNGRELHLLGLFIPESGFSKVTELMKEGNERKEQSNIDLVNALNNVGFDLDYNEIKKATPNGKVNRAHIAAALTEKGYTESIKQAFKELLSPSVGYYKEPRRPTVWEMIDFILEIGAIPVLAHPFLNLSSAELEVFLPAAKARGLVGMECYYSTYTPGEVELSITIAKRFDLKLSGGSDFHGLNKPDIKLGTGRGDLKVPYALVGELVKNA